MPSMIAICDDCGTPFGSGFSISNSSASFSGCKAGPCPKCGGMGSVPDGRYAATDRMITLLSGPKATHDALNRLAVMFEQARENQWSAEKVSKQIVQNTPEMASLSQFLPTNRSELYAFLGFILAMITLALQLQQDPGITEEGLKDALRELRNESMPHQVEPKPQPRQMMPVPKFNPPAVTYISRNALCPCGSGEKYKRCCGSKALSPGKLLQRTTYAPKGKKK